MHTNLNRNVVATIAILMVVLPGAPVHAAWLTGAAASAGAGEAAVPITPNVYSSAQNNSPITTTMIPLPVNFWGYGSSETLTSVASGGATVNTTGGGAGGSASNVLASQWTPSTTTPTGIEFDYVTCLFAVAQASAGFTYNNVTGYSNEGAASSQFTAGGTAFSIPGGSGAPLPNSLQASSPAPGAGGVAQSYTPPVGGSFSLSSAALHQRAITLSVQNATSWGTNTDTLISVTHASTSYPGSYWQQHPGQTALSMIAQAGPGVQATTSAGGAGGGQALASALCMESNKIISIP